MEIGDNNQIGNFSIDLVGYVGNLFLSISPNFYSFNLNFIFRGDATYLLLFNTLKLKYFYDFCYGLITLVYEKILLLLDSRSLGSRCSPEIYNLFLIVFYFRYFLEIFLIAIWSLSSPILHIKI